MKLKLQDMTDESLSLARAQGMNRKTVGKFFNMLEKVATEKCVDCSSYCERKKRAARCRRSRKFRSLQRRLLSLFGSDIVYLFYIFLMLILLHYFE